MALWWLFYYQPSSSTRHTGFLYRWGEVLHKAPHGCYVNGSLKDGIFMTWSLCTHWNTKTWINTVAQISMLSLRSFVHTFKIIQCSSRLSMYPARPHFSPQQMFPVALCERNSCFSWNMSNRWWEKSRKERKGVLVDNTLNRATVQREAHFWGACLIMSLCSSHRKG